MPTAVTKLPRDKRGFPVPWVSEWAPGEAGVVRLIWEGPGGLVVQTPCASCACKPGVGTPDLGALCVERQIRGMLERLCDVCGEFIPAGPIYFLGGATIAKSGVGFRECGLHYECALYSAQVCPGLTTRGNKVMVYEATAYHLQPQYMRPGVEGVIDDIFDSFQDPRLVEIVESRKVPMVLTAAYAVPIDATITPAPEWVAAQLKERVAP
jgi:hypothetical protein